MPIRPAAHSTTSCGGATREPSLAVPLAVLRIIAVPLSVLRIAAVQLGVPGARAETATDSTPQEGASSRHHHPRAASSHTHRFLGWRFLQRRAPIRRAASSILASSACTCPFPTPVWVGTLEKKE